ncbi:MAG: DUF2851 family protein [Bacteroidetes bacterium]|nr:MAG: DUF2851 family protein [Bacteroidota bacterium]
MMFTSIPEDFLHYVWRSLNFDLKGLITTEGEPVRIHRQGILNTNQGPDFLEARIGIGEMEWHGQVEIHLSSQDWYRHGHDKDPHYNNVILHVVLESGGGVIMREDGTAIPELELKGRIPARLQQQYERLRLSQGQIPCAFALPKLKDIYIYPWVERLSVERMEAKAARMKARLDVKVHDWEQVLWEELAAMMGGPVNQESMRQMAQCIPYQVLKKYRHKLLQTEALLFGGCGMLAGEQPADAYYQHLRQEWHYLKKVHQLGSSFIALRFMRMRPASFPSIRLSQLAVMLTTFYPLIRLLEPAAHQQLIQTEVRASAYWDQHYRFGEQAKKSQPKRLGMSQKHTLIINTLIPLSLLYHRAHGREDTHELVEAGLGRLKPEHNRLLKDFEALGIANEHALHSQGLIQLKKHYCMARKCLQCGIGHAVMQHADTTGG